jgi:Uma2 family endonuclease
MPKRYRSRLTVDEYLELPETATPMELVHGIVRDAPSPEFPHQSVDARTALCDRTTKLGWYRQHGVLEYWLVDVDRQSVDVVDLTQSNHVVRFSGRASIRSAVLDQWVDSADTIFDLQTGLLM